MKKSWLIGVLGSMLVLSAMSLYANEEERMCKRPMMKDADTNHDGKVSYDEFKAQHEKHMQEMFKKLDANGDGFVDEAERKAAHDKMREKMKDMHQKTNPSDDHASHDH